jgi:hypothetical protein
MEMSNEKQTLVAQSDGWTFTTGDGCITVTTPGGASAVLWERGHGGVENLAYRMAVMLSSYAAPAPVALTPAQQHADRLLSALELSLHLVENLGGLNCHEAITARVAIAQATGQEGGAA